ncbi:TraU family protein, partial [Vibrio sp. MM46]
MKQRHFPLLLCCLLVFIAPSTLAASAACKSRFINPITDICWDCLFPMTIGSATVMPSKYPDTNNPTLPISYCPKPPPIFVQVGVNIGYWEPYALTDVTRVPYCMVNMGTQLSG